MIEQQEQKQSDNKETLHLKRERTPTVRTRVPLGRRSPLDVPAIPGYHQEWVETTLGNVEAYQAAGYEFVTGSIDSVGKESQLGSTIERVVNKDPNATCKTNVLMKIREEWYQEDLKAMHQAGYDTLKQIDPKRNGRIDGSDYGRAQDDYGNDFNFFK